MRAPLTTVQAWLGHSSIEIAARYLHHLGDAADRSALQLLNGAPDGEADQRDRRPG
ncbi:hypothetical protein [Georgenia thermotolerans]|uniref:Tyrosine-type recombinase/integrase n=1 Tax=Georgenia thermotolerans TaxID=527326 RepID=A0A7J5UMS8_9MICO|nr:hypothetical protein [Georgenia thermotolerans]KAE8763695.1 hypothetical protein GB883_12815 [Georgenia thermotolerans]